MQLGLCEGLGCWQWLWRLELQCRGSACTCRLQLNGDRSRWRGLRLWSVMGNIDARSSMLPWAGMRTGKRWSGWSRKGVNSGTCRCAAVGHNRSRGEGGRTTARIARGCVVDDGDGNVECIGESGNGGDTVRADGAGLCDLCSERTWFGKILRLRLRESGRQDARGGRGGE
jgi:hypothetical protein